MQATSTAAPASGWGNPVSYEMRPDYAAAAAGSGDGIMSVGGGSGGDWQSHNEQPEAAPSRYYESAAHKMTQHDLYVGQKADEVCQRNIFTTFML